MGSPFNILEPGTPATGEAETGSGGAAGQRLQGEGQVRLPLVIFTALRKFHNNFRRFHRCKSTTMIIFALPLKVGK